MRIGSSRAKPADALATFAALLAFIALLATPSPSHAYNIYLDHNTDGILQTFNNVVEGPVTAPIDIVVEFSGPEIGITFFQTVISWGYGGGGGGVGCYDVFGSVDYIYQQPLPDTGPFTSIIPFTCLCRGTPRCFCDAQLWIQADVNLTAPGLYRLATLDFSRVGFAADCSYPVYPEATFSAGPWPFSVMEFRDPAITVGQGVVTHAWGRIKATYR
ncbi:MAG: hypothetical protein HKN12_02595 [Gemmatimonadetes bacterium]|nr:hypothetical protein [Gemmatimonadota bacterium]